MQWLYRGGRRKAQLRRSASDYWLPATGHRLLDVLMDDMLWFKDAVFYEVPVRSFYDSTNDGSGDFAGLSEKLPYIRGLGVDCLWLLPFYPSPLRDDGYDIADFYNIHPDYGT